MCVCRYGKRTDYINTQGKAETHHSDRRKETNTQRYKANMHTKERLNLLEREHYVGDTLKKKPKQKKSKNCLLSSLHQSNLLLMYICLVLLIFISGNKGRWILHTKKKLKVQADLGQNFGGV